ncbi:hypothetical protein V8F33_010529 [Rhypophila sp. PSN 637]
MSLAGIDLCSLPAAAPPAGEISNLVDPPSLKSVLIGFSTVLLILSVPFVTIRIWINRQKLKLADYFIIICAILNIAFTAIILTQARYGRHQWNVPACWFDGYHMKAIFLVSFLFGFISFGRAAILLMYRDIFSISRTTHIAIWIGLVLNFLIYIPSIPIAVYYETPRAGQSWEELIYTVPNLEPILVPYGIATGAAALLMDVYIFILPLPVVLRLNLSRTKKIQALAIFATALLAVVASIIALVYRIALGDNLKNDSTWSTTCLFISMLVENNIVPLVALQEDLYRRCQERGIDSHIWTSRGTNRAASIILITPESAVTKGFEGFVNRLHGRGQLDRVVIDESHTVLDSERGFRLQLGELGGVL